MAVILLCLCNSCGILSKSQTDAIQRFSVACDSFSATPGRIIHELSSLRTERGTYYAASLSTPELRLEELENLRKTDYSDEKQAKKMDLHYEILKKYMRALRSLSHENRYADLSREFRSLGKNLDSLIFEYNSLELTKSLPTGIGKAAGEIFGIGARQWMRHRQLRQVKTFVSEGDTLVALLTQSLREGINAPALDTFLESEARGQRADYLSYLNHKKEVSPAEDLLFLERLDRLDALKTLRTQSLRAALSLRNTHRTLYTSLHSRKKISDFYHQLILFEEDLAEIQKNLHKIKNL